MNFILKRGYRHEFLFLRTSQQNEIVERKNQTL
jgi:hypothetical protein